MKVRRISDIHDDGLLGELNQPLRKGVMVRTEELECAAALLNNRFPFVLNRIDWANVPGHLMLPAEPKSRDEKKHPELYFNRRAPDLRTFLKAAAQTHGIEMKTPVLFMGDSVSFVLRMTLADLAEHSPILFSYPQHVYVIPECGRWCFNYTFEDDLFFGKATKKND